MNENNMRKIMVSSVSLTCKKLTDAELAALNVVTQLGQLPYNRVFDYEKVKGLFTEANGMRMHRETKLALASVVKQRLVERVP